MTVYLDILFGLNTIINYLLLRGAAAIGGCPAKRLRMLAGACVGGLYAAAAVLPEARWLNRLPLQLLCAAVMAVFAFGLRLTTVRQTLFFLALSFAFGGAVLLAVQRAEPNILLLNGRTYYAVTTPALLLLAGAIYGLAAVVLSGFGMHTGGDLISVNMELAGQTVTVRALRDTGNTLRDPVSGQFVIVADRQVLAQLLREPTLSEADLNDPAATLASLSARYPHIRFRLLPYRAVGTDNGLLLAVTCTVSHGKKRPQKIPVAFSPTAVSGDGTFQALTGGQIT